MISHAWTVCTDAWLVGHHQPDIINIYILNENFFLNFKIYFEARFDVCFTKVIFGIFG